MATSMSARGSARTSINYQVLRSVVSPADHEAGRKRYCGLATADQFFALSTDENVRAYLGEDEEGNKRKSPLVNLAIRDTVTRCRDLFAMLNTGFVIVAKSASVDDDKRTLRLSDPSIVNGAQTNGVLRDYFDKHPEDVEYPCVNFEVIVTDDDDLIGSISIARNFQTRVADLSIYGRQGLFDELEGAMKKRDPSVRLRRRETDFSDDFLDTEKLVQALTALMPDCISVPSADQRRAGTPETKYRVYAYRHRARCLKDFAHVMTEPDKWPQAHAFFVGVAWDAWERYSELKSEQSFSRLHHVRGEQNGGQKIVAPEGVPDGIVFPMLSALSNFVKPVRSGWKLDVPGTFPWTALYDHAMVLFKSTAGHNPNTMGKQSDCYIALHGLCNMYFAMAGRK
jgi:hypothetical protein